MGEKYPIGPTESEGAQHPVPEQGSELYQIYTTNGPVFTMNEHLIPPGAEVTYVGSFVDPIDKEAGERVGDSEFGVWNVYNVTVEGGVEKIHTVPDSEADKKVRGVWDPDEEQVLEEQQHIIVHEGDYQEIEQLAERWAFEQVLGSPEASGAILDELVTFGKSRNLSEHIVQIAHQTLVDKGLATQEGGILRLNEDAIREKYSFGSLFDTPLSPTEEE